MNVIAVHYDLSERGEQAYAAVIETLEQFDSLHRLQSSWYVATELTARQLYRLLKPLLDEPSGDRLDVYRVDVAGGYGLTSVSPRERKWILSRFQAARNARKKPLRAPRIKTPRLISRLGSVKKTRKT